VSTSSCRKEEGEKNLIDYKWSGTIRGCIDDKGFFNRERVVFKGECNKDSEEAYGLEPIPSMWT
jgi:hypothetical protein